MKGDARAPRRWANLRFRLRTSPRTGPHLLRWRRLTGALRAEPAFVIIGAQKSGTTSLYQWLCAHPDVAPGFRKETHFFDLLPQEPPSAYRAFFPTRAWLRTRRPARITGEASPDYLRVPWVAEALTTTLPRTRLIVVLRNPVDRAYSHYQHAVRRGWEHLDFDRALAAEADRLDPPPRRPDPDWARRDTRFAYVARGRYATQLQPWLDRARRRLLVLLFDDLVEDPERTYRETLSFLGLRQHSLPDYPRHNARAYPEMAPEVRRRLEGDFADDNVRLRALLDRDLPW